MLEFKTTAEVENFYRGKGKKLQETDRPGHNRVSLIEGKSAQEIKIDELERDNADLKRKLGKGPGVHGMGATHEPEEAEEEVKVRNWIRLGLSGEEARIVANLPASAMREAARKLGLSEADADAFAMLCDQPKSKNVERIVSEAAITKKVLVGFRG